MSKKVNENTATTATAKVTISPAAMRRDAAAGETLKDLFEKYPNASLRKLAAVTQVNYGVLLKKSKDPVPGEPYDPEATNWIAIANKLREKGIDFVTLDWDALNEGPNRKGSTLQKDIDAFKVGDKVYLRRDNKVPYEILYKTATHIVIMQVGTSEPQAWANNTFLFNGPVYEPRTTTNKEKEEA